VTVIICCSLNRHLTIVFLWANFAGQTAFVAVFAAAVSNAIGYPKFNSRSHDAVIRVYDAAGNVIVFQRPVGTMMRPGGFLVRCFT